MISVAALIALSVLVHENGRIPKKQKNGFYITYLIIGLAAAAEWTGIQISGYANTPQWLLIAIKCIDYILTPAAGAALIRKLGIKNTGIKILNGIITGNAIFQIIAAFFGWMTVIDKNNAYSHGPLYFIYIIVYVSVIIILIFEFLIYGKGFNRQNRYSLYAIMLLVVLGILSQEILGKDCRTAYLTMTLGAALIFIHYLEYEQISADVHINRQAQMLNRDSMTGLLSRYAYSEALEKYESQNSVPDDLAVFSIDVNGLKSVNDSMGHLAGDELICGAAKCIYEVFHPYGLCYRTGGDEFIILAHTDRKTAEELITKLSEKTGFWSGSIVKSLSLSAGYTLASDHTDISLEKLILFADKEMYKDKNRYYSNK